MQPKPHILPTVIIAQFACTSPWFAGNTIIDELIIKTGPGKEIIGWVLSSVQLGFIIGTLLFGLLMIVDRLAPSKVFMICAFCAALSNLILIFPNLTSYTLLFARFSTGFFLAGIYPVGMKIAADYYEKGLGKALGFLVGALVLGTAFPYLLNGTDWGKNYEIVIQVTTWITTLGGLLLYLLVPNGPFRLPSKRIQLDVAPKLFKNIRFKKAALGYFGHMWELYAFWAFTPIAISFYNSITGSEILVPLWTGIIIGIGSVSCGLGGIISEKIGSRKVAVRALIISGICCLLSPVLFKLPPVQFLMVWSLWGFAVTADSPQLSKLVAVSATGEIKGTALTLTTCIGFGITIVSIQLLSYLQHIIGINYLFLVLAVYPALGVWHLIRLKNV
ncbi:MFS transporter [Maribacter litopenaei]|uniref:MFS transporter n=1 Tax=Maribacter litopenaei TaxID=2976127 RepID=A0ABY5Y3X4_9FLAO|nr:MFS transporter [Maribacter litopenaei]UWX53710.1 MFS transporter [Maribacter litopenaei]